MEKILPMARPRTKPASWADIADRPDCDQLEIIGGEIVRRAMPSIGHAGAEAKYGAVLDPFNRRPGGPRGPGGWRLFVEIHTGYPGGEIYIHDVAGWRRERAEVQALRSSDWPLMVRPDWVCEVVSPKHEKRDYVTKPLVLHAARVPHYWILHPEERILLIHRWSDAGYIVVQRAAAGETIRAEPFEAIEIRVSELLGDDDDDAPP
jgi:Uma2 family endonuclease